MNRKPILLLLLVVFTGMALLSGCSKDEDSPSSGNKTRRELLTSKTWELKSAESQGEDVTTAVALGLRKLKFDANGMVTVTGDFTGTGMAPWTLAENDTKIIIGQGTEDETEATILSLTSSELKIRMLFEDEGEEYQTDITYR